MVVHSLKDVPPEPEAGRMIYCLEAGDPRDAYVGARPLAAEAGLRIGTSAPRRRALLKTLWPQVAVVEMRGNVDTRLNRLAQGDVDGLLLSLAGLKRLGIKPPCPVKPLSPKQCVPAAAQGVVGVACREDDKEILSLLQAVHHAPTGMRVDIERAFLRGLHASCESPVGVYATIDGNTVQFRAIVLTTNGKKQFFVSETVPLQGAVKKARAFGERLRIRTVEEGFFV